MEAQVIDKIILNGFPYMIDRKNKVLLPKEVPRPAISFSSMLQQEGFYRAIIRLKGNAVPAWDERHGAISIPSELLDTPLALNEAGLQEFNRQSYQNSWGVVVYDKQITERLNGKLPEIDICGDRFTVDVVMRELRLHDNPTKTISLRNLGLGEDLDNYDPFYNTVLKKTVSIPEEITELPVNVVQLCIPFESALDPIGTARQSGLWETELLSMFPVKEDLKALVRPLTKTYLPQMVTKNRRLAGLDHQQQYKPKM